MRVRGSAKILFQSNDYKGCQFCMTDAKVCIIELIVGGVVIFYHYDRSGALNPGQKVELSREYSELDVRAEGVAAVLSEMFPEGLSRHGRRYLDIFVSRSMVGAVDAGSLKYALHELPSFQIEWNLELVRRILYPELPSRCQSIFCLNSVEEFQNWPELMVGEGQLVEILVPDNGKYVTLDSQMLRGGFVVLDDGTLAGSSPMGYDFARRYWSGELSPTSRLEVVAELPVVVGRVIGRF